MFCSQIVRDSRDFDRSIGDRRLMPEILLATFTHNGRLAEEEITQEESENISEDQVSP
jgi:hypothetical protein